MAKKYPSPHIFPGTLYNACTKGCRSNEAKGAAAGLWNYFLEMVKTPLVMFGLMNEEYENAASNENDQQVNVNVTVDMGHQELDFDIDDDNKDEERIMLEYLA